MRCTNCSERIEFCEYHGWEGNDGSSFCDYDFQPTGEYTIEHTPEDY